MECQHPGLLSNDPRRIAAILGFLREDQPQPSLEVLGS